MINTIDFHIPKLEQMKKYPNEIFYIGDTNILNNKLVSIVGTRKPTTYTKQFTDNISRALSQSGFTIVSGAAMGVDAIAHKAAGEDNTIAVAGTGLDVRYPAINKKLIEDIEKSGLMLSMFKEKTKSMPYNFPLRNEMVVALGEVLIVTQADKKSGTMRSVEYALKMGKKIFVLPHRIGESEGTQELLEKGFATAIYDIDRFIKSLGGATKKEDADDISKFFKTNPTYDEAMQIYPSETFEYELNGKIKIQNGKVVYIV
jgi:DNA processing protein